MEKALYLSETKDYWLVPQFKKRRIISINIQSRAETVYPFMSEQEARDNYNNWIDKQKIRLPKSFLINAKNYNQDMVRELKKLGFKQEKKQSIRKYIFYHQFENKYHCSHIDEMNGIILPTLNFKDIKKITSQHDEIAKDEIYNEGLFNLAI